MTVQPLHFHDDYHITFISAPLLTLVNMFLTSGVWSWAMAMIHMTEINATEMHVSVTEKQNKSQRVIYFSHVVNTIFTTGTIIQMSFIHIKAGIMHKCNIGSSLLSYHCIIISSTLQKRIFNVYILSNHTPTLLVNNDKIPKTKN